MMNSLAETIKGFREARGLSLQDLAGKCACSKAHIWDLEQGKSINPTIQTLSVLSDALWIDLGALAHVAAQPWKRGAIIEARAAIKEQGGA